MKQNTFYQFQDTVFQIVKPINAKVYHVEFYTLDKRYLHTDYTRRLVDIKTTYKGAKLLNSLINT